MSRGALLNQQAAKICRICLDNDQEKDLISPCWCSGGSAYVHRNCLDNWRSVNKNGRAFKFCDVCHFEYVIQSVVDDPAADKRRLLWFRLLVSRDVIGILLLLQGIIVGLAFLLQAADKNSKELRNLYPDSMNSFGVYYLSSFTLFLALLGFFGLIGYCCGMTRGGVDATNGNYPCYQCYCVGLQCDHCSGSGGNCQGGGGGGDGGGVVVAVLVIVVIFAIIGVVVGVFLSFIIIQKIIKRHTNRLWLRQETKKYAVKDFQDRRSELPNRSIGRSANQSSLTNKAYNPGSLKTPSAPMELSAAALNAQ